MLYMHGWLKKISISVLYSYMREYFPINSPRWKKGRHFGISKCISFNENDSNESNSTFTEMWSQESNWQ